MENKSALNADDLVKALQEEGLSGEEINRLAEGIRSKTGVIKADEILARQPGLQAAHNKAIADRRFADAAKIVAEMDQDADKLGSLGLRHISHGEKEIRLG